MPAQKDLFSSNEPEVLPKKAADRLVPFGKYKNQPFEVLLTDAGYAMWLLSSAHDKMEKQFPALLAFLIGRYGNPENTPAHNRLQNRFLDENFAVQFALAVNSGLKDSIPRLASIDFQSDWRKFVRQEFEYELRVAGLGKSQDNQAMQQLKERLELCTERMELSASGGLFAESSWDTPVRVFGLEFEKDSADVFFEVGWSCSLWVSPNPRIRDYGAANEVIVSEYSNESRSTRFRIEVKPILGDDYPAVLRAMKAVKCKQLLVGEYCGAGATWEEVVKVFGLSDIRAVLLSEVEDTAITEILLRTPIRGLTASQAREIVAEEFSALTQK